MTADENHWELCSCCLLTIELDDEIECPVCNSPHHRSCWEDEWGCTVAGCSAGPMATATSLPAAGPTPSSAQPDAPPAVGAEIVEQTPAPSPAPSVQPAAAPPPAPPTLVAPPSFSPPPAVAPEVEILTVVRPSPALSAGGVAALTAPSLAPPLASAGPGLAPAGPPAPPAPMVVVPAAPPARPPHASAEAAANRAAFASASGQPPSWLPDPFRRHQHRYWNGKRWTDQVATSGVQSTDPYQTKGVPLPSPSGAEVLQASWHPDPSRRHVHRYWNGKRWTDQVADNGVVAMDPPTLEGV